MPRNIEQYRLMVENRLTRLETTLTEIKDNHLAHLDAKIDRLQWFIITTLVGVIISLGLIFFNN